jgi:N-acetylated-alpha-linked acidic dipeptidase
MPRLALAGAVALACSLAPSLAAQTPLERRLLESVDTAVIRAHMRTLAARPHVAGTPAQRATADFVLRQMASWGLDTMRARYRVYLPYHDSTIVEVVRGSARERLDLSEPPIASDPTTREPAWPAMNGYSGAGDITAPVVYVGFGLARDYAALDSMGVDVRGKVVLARYGRSFRGIKAREAERAGAAALILYSDPLDDGFGLGAVYPDGLMRNPEGVQRGSIKNGQGDPSTPFGPSVAGAPRLEEGEMGLAIIPVVPIGYGNAERMLRHLQGAEVPSGWQGGIDITYRVGGDSAVLARVAVWPERGERAYKEIENTIGILRGAVVPDEWIIIGGHRDAWSPGAVDDVGGVISTMEAARAWGEAARAGLRPARTLVFGTWDAEEWGIIGSTEWVEEHAIELGAKAVAYINQDVVASGWQFGASGTASLHGLVREVTGLVRQPGDTGTVLARWRRTGATVSRPEPSLGDLGGGSDFIGFYNHLGIPSVGFGFGGPGGVYHSGYDTYTFVERLADPGYEAHRAASQVAALLLARLSETPLLPYDFEALGAYLPPLVERTARLPGAANLGTEFAELTVAAGELTAAGRLFNARRATVPSNLSARELAPANRVLRRVEAAFLRPEGLVGRPFLRNLLFVADIDDGYANVAFPTVVEALRRGDLSEARAAVQELTRRTRDAAALVHLASGALP